MRYRIVGDIDAPPAEVIRYFHDHVEEVAAKLPNVERVEVLERQAEQTRLKWFAKGEIPYAFHKVVSPDDLWWEDDTLYDFEANELGARVFRPGMKRFQSQVRIGFEESEEGKTSYQIEGEVRIDVPMFGQMLERFFVGKVEENMRAFYELLGKEVVAHRTNEGPKADAPAPDDATGEREP